MQIPINYKPRGYQAEALAALDSGVRLAVWCWARRAGKDMTAFAYAVKKMVESPMNVVLVFPTKAQGKDAFWDNVENDGFKTIEHIPKALIARQDNTDMKITLINGSTFQVLGATEPDALRGANAKLYIFSEFVDIDSGAYEVIVPVVEVNGGQIIIQSTPKIDGISGGTFKLMFDEALNDPMEFASRITAEEYLTPEALERLRLKAIKKYGNDFFFRQEFLCDWGQASASSYYGQILQKKLEKGDIDVFPYNSAYPAYTAWDLGMSDSTAIVFFQYYDKRVVIIDYYETHDVGIEQIISVVNSKPYNLKWNFLPHDGSVRDIHAVERITRIREAGLPSVSLLRRTNREDGINRVVEGLRTTMFNEATTTELVRKLKIYKKKYNPVTGDYQGPDHKTESHAADSVRYMFDAIDQEFNKETCEMYLSQGSYDNNTYESDMPATNLYSPVY